MAEHRRSEVNLPVHRELPSLDEQKQRWHEVYDSTLNRANLRQAFALIASLSLSPEQVEKIEKAYSNPSIEPEEQDTMISEVLEAYDDQPENQKADAVVGILKVLNEQYSLFGSSDAPFALKDEQMQADEELEYSDSLAQEYYREAVQQKPTAAEESTVQRKRMALLQMLQVLHGNDTVYTAQQEAGYYLAAVPPRQLRHLRENIRQERGIHTKQMIKGDSIALDPRRFMLNEEEVRKEFGVEGMGNLVALVRAGDPLEAGSNINFGIFSKQNEQGEREFTLHYMPSALERDEIREGHRGSSKEDDITHADVVVSGIKFGPYGIKSGYLGAASRRDTPVLEGLIGEVNNTLSERGVKRGRLGAPDETLAPFHLNISLGEGGGRLILHDIRSGDTLGVTVVQSALFGERDRPKLKDLIHPIGGHAVQGSSELRF